MRNFNPFILLVMIGMAAASAGLYLFNKGNFTTTFAVASAIAIASFPLAIAAAVASAIATIIFAAAGASAIATVIFAAVAGVVAFAGAVAPTTIDKKFIKILVFIYEGCMTASLAAFLLS